MTCANDPLRIKRHRSGRHARLVNTTPIMRVAMSVLCGSGLRKYPGAATVLAQMT